MFEDQSRDMEHLADRPSTGLVDFASEVVALLLTGAAERPTCLDEVLLQRFMQVILGSDSSKVADLRQEFRRLRVTPSVLAEIYIPEAARRFGDAWMNDTMSFCDVSMGSARLQAVLHELTSGFFDEERRCSSKGAVLVVLPKDEQHTLSGLSLAWHLRRRGVSVCLQISPTVADLRLLVATRRFDGAFVSVGSPRLAPSLKSLVNALKSEDNTSRLVVAVGGAVLATHDLDAVELGADVVTSDLNEALDMMGILTARTRAGRF